MKLDRKNRVFSFWRVKIFEFSEEAYWSTWEKSWFSIYLFGDRYFRHVKIGRLQVNFYCKGSVLL